MTRKTSKPVAKTATHRSVENCTVKFTQVNDPFGGALIRVVFTNGEKTTMSPSRFNEMFVTN